MSLPTSQWVREHSEARGNDRLVLWNIADEADDLGLNARPSQRRLAHYARCGQTTVRRCIERLEGAGELLVKRPATVGRGHFTRYVVVMGRDPEKLADQLGWPRPRLNPHVVAEWEQLSLETGEMRARQEADGFTLTPRSAPVAPYPAEVPQDGDNSGDEPGEAPKRAGTRRPGGRVNAPERAALGGADPQTRTSDPGPRASPKPWVPQPPLPGVPEAEARATVDRVRAQLHRSQEVQT